MRWRWRAPARALEGGDQDLLEAALRQDQHEREGTPERRDRELEAPLAAVVERDPIDRETVLEELARDAELVEEAKRGRMEGERVAQPGADVGLVDRLDGEPAAARQRQRRREADGPRAAHQHVDVALEAHHARGRSGVDESRCAAAHRRAAAPRPLPIEIHAGMAAREGSRRRSGAQPRAQRGGSAGELLG